MNPHRHQKTLTYIPVTKLVPRTWHTWFFSAISEDAPFSWGDNEHSLTTASALAAHAETTFAVMEANDPNNQLPPPATRTRFLNKLRLLKETLVDLES